jgi:hypothetical protein
MSEVLENELYVTILDGHRGSNHSLRQQQKRFASMAAGSKYELKRWKRVVLQDSRVRMVAFKNRGKKPTSPDALRSRNPHPNSVHQLHLEVIQLPPY